MARDPIKRRSALMRWRERNRERYRERYLDGARARNAARRSRIKELGLTTYMGPPCKRGHSGERRASNNCCVECQRERHKVWMRSGGARKRQQERQRSDDHRAYRRNRLKTSEVGRANNKASQHRHQARKCGAIVGDARAINRAFRALVKEARALGMSIDHRIPLAGCRVCGEKGTHEPSNWALLPRDLNSAKGNRCMSCWMFDLGRPCIVWLPGQVRHVVGNVVRNEICNGDICM